MKIDELNIDDLKPYALNAKRHPQTQIEGIAESIRRFGFTQPIVVDDKNEIVIGHGRHAAAKLIGYTKVPCIRLDQLNEKQVRALRLIDNRIAETGWDNEFLIQDLSDLDFGFNEFNIDFDFVGQYISPNEFDENELIGGADTEDGKLRKIVVTFRTEDSVDEFAKLIGQNISNKCKSIYFPEQEDIEFELKKSKHTFLNLLDKSC